MFAWGWLVMMAFYGSRMLLLVVVPPWACYLAQTRVVMKITGRQSAGGSQYVVDRYWAGAKSFSKVSVWKRFSGIISLQHGHRQLFLSFCGSMNLCGVKRARGSCYSCIGHLCFPLHVSCGVSGCFAAAFARHVITLGVYLLVVSAAC